MVRKHNLTHFSKLVPWEDFSALGDDKGLLILAQTHRPWFPTAQQTEKYFANIKFMEGKSFHEITLS